MLRFDAYTLGYWEHRLIKQQQQQQQTIRRQKWTITTPSESIQRRTVRIPETEQQVRLRSPVVTTTAADALFFLWLGGRKAAGGVIGGAVSQIGTTSGWGACCPVDVSVPGSSSLCSCFSLRRRLLADGVKVFTAAKKPTPLILPAAFLTYLPPRSGLNKCNRRPCLTSQRISEVRRGVYGTRRGLPVTDWRERLDPTDAASTALWCDWDRTLARWGRDRERKGWKCVRDKSAWGVDVQGRHGERRGEGTVRGRQYNVPTSKSRPAKILSQSHYDGIAEKRGDRGRPGALTLPQAATSGSRDRYRG
jgi:hypothetical protein